MYVSFREYVNIFDKFSKDKIVEIIINKYVFKHTN
jgi:hypothetical protein